MVDIIIQTMRGLKFESNTEREDVVSSCLAHYSFINNAVFVL